MERYEKTWRPKVVCVIQQSHVHSFACDVGYLGSWGPASPNMVAQKSHRQGGPHNHQIGALAVQLLEVDSPMFKEPSRSVASPSRLRHAKS